MRLSSTIVFALAVCSGSLPAQQYSISTFAGGGPSPTPALATSVTIGSPLGVAADLAGNVYLTSVNCVFRVDAKGILTRIAGTGRPGFSGDGGLAINAQLNVPAAIAVDASGAVYIADYANGRVRKISPKGIIS